MILYVVTDTHERYREGQNWLKHRNALADAAGDACVILHYSYLSPEVLAQIRPWAICHSGCSTDYKDFDVLSHPAYRSVVTGSDVPQIGLCGGHQIVASFFGSTLGPMRRLRPGEPDPSGYHPGRFKEWGIYPVRRIAPDPIFRNCGKTIRVQEYHYWEVKKLGPALVLLASSENCPVQVFRHRTKPIYGTQFHPEQSTDAYPDGAKVLRNFFRIARRVSGRPARLSSRALR